MKHKIPNERTEGKIKLTRRDLDMMCFLLFRLLGFLGREKGVQPHKIQTHQLQQHGTAAAPAATTTALAAQATPPPPWQPTTTMATRHHHHTAIATAICNTIYQHQHHPPNPPTTRKAQSCERTPNVRRLALTLVFVAYRSLRKASSCFFHKTRKASYADTQQATAFTPPLNYNCCDTE